MPDKIAELRRELSIANRILANEDVVDAFGHISVRHPDDPSRYLISRHRAAELVQPADILEFTLDSVPVKKTDQRLYSELVIHGEVYKARPDVNSVCHHHAPSVMPYCITGVALVPVMPLGATMGRKVPIWDSRDEFGDTELLVTKPAEGRAMAKALGDCWMVLLARHGATVAAHSLHECVFRSIYICRNADLQMPRHGDGQARSAQQGRDRKMRGPQPDPAHHGAGVGILGAPPGEGRLRDRRTFAQGQARGRPAAAAGEIFQQRRGWQQEAVGVRFLNGSRITSPSRRPFRQPRAGSCRYPRPGRRSFRRTPA